MEMLKICWKCERVAETDLEIENYAKCDTCGRHGYITLSNSKEIKRFKIITSRKTGEKIKIRLPSIFIPQS
jgi:hypothetical protein